MFKLKRFCLGFFKSAIGYSNPSIKKNVTLNNVGLVAEV